MVTAATSVTTNTVVFFTTTTIISTTTASTTSTTIIFMSVSICTHAFSSMMCESEDDLKERIKLFSFSHLFFHPKKFSFLLKEGSRY